MSTVLIILAIIGGLVLLTLLFGFMSPKHTYMERSVAINADPDILWNQMNDLKSFVNNWSPWTEKDPNMKQEFSEDSQGVGAAYSWSGHRRKVGSGKMEILESDDRKRVKCNMMLKGQDDAYASWHMSDNGDDVEVKWDFKKNHGANPISRIFGRMMGKFFGPDYEYGFKCLNENCKSNT